MALAPIPAVPDAERRTRYVLTAPSSATMQVGFAIWASGSDYANWIEIWQNGVKLPTTSWTLSHPSGPLANLPRPITAAIVTPQVPFSGTIDIVGAERPRRPIQFTEGVGVPARDHNRAYNDSTAIDREFWDIFRRTLRGAPGEDINPIPPVVTRKTKALGFDTLGHPIVSEKTMSEIDDGIDLIKYLEGRLAGLQAGNPNIIILSSVDALRNLTAEVTATMAVVHSYFTGGDTGGGIFRLDLDDTTSAEDDGLIFVDVSLRRWKRIVGPFATPEMFGAPWTPAATANTNSAAMAAACFAQHVPLALTDICGGTLPVQLKVDPLLGTTDDREAWAKIKDACDWAASCRKTAAGQLEVLIDTALKGPIPVYGQYIHIPTTWGSSDVGTLAISMPSPMITSKIDKDFQVGFGAKESRIVQINMNDNPLGAFDADKDYPQGVGYTAPPLVSFTRGVGDTTGGGATATAFLDPNPPPGQEGRLGGIVIEDGGSLWTKDPIVVLTPVGAAPTKPALPTAGMNPNIVLASCYVTEFPAEIQKGMPFGVYGYGHDIDDPGSINGAHRVFNFALNTPGVPADGGRVFFEMTAPRELAQNGGIPTETSSNVLNALVVWPHTWLVSTGGWFGAGQGEGMFTCNGNGTMALHNVAAVWEPNVSSAVLTSGARTPQNSMTDQCGIQTQRDGAVLYLKDRVIVHGFPGSGVRVARGVLFMNRSYVGGGLQQGVESYIGVQVQNGGYIGMTVCSVGSTNFTGIAIQGGAQGYVTNCHVGACKEGIKIFGWCDVQVTKVYGCTTGIQCLSGGTAYGVWKDPAVPANERASTDVVRCTTGLDVSLNGRMDGRIKFVHSITTDSSVPLNTSAFGGGYFENADTTNQTVQLLQTRRKYGTATGAANAATTTQPTGVVTMPGMNALSGQTELITINNPYVTPTAIIRCAVSNTPGAGGNTGGNAVIGAITAFTTGTPRFTVQILNVAQTGGAAFNGSVNISFMIDEAIL